MQISRLSGVVTALITPFRNADLDEAAFVRLVERQVGAGVQGLLVASPAAGEAATLKPQEVRRLLDLCVAAVGGRIPVIADASSNSTLTTIGLVRQAQGGGADAALVSAPWYNRPSQEGIFRHYQAIAEAVDFPILIGNSPQRAAVDIHEPTLERLAELPHLIGIEENSINVARVSAIRSRCGSDFRVLAGHDVSVLGALALGAHGLTSLVANVVPHAVVEMHALWSAGDWHGALHAHDKLFELTRFLTADPSPAAAKLALGLLGLCEPDVRLPITPCSTDMAPKVEIAMARLESRLSGRSA